MIKSHLLWPVTIFLIVLMAIPQGVLAAPQGWTPVGTGIDYQEFHLTSPRPVNIFVTRMDRNNPNVTIESSIAGGKIASGRETITGMASRYDDAINYWGNTWGGRNTVISAINGYFFDLSTGTPWSGVVNSGWYAKRFTETVGDAGFAWALDRSAHIGSCVYHDSSKNEVIFTNSTYNPNIDAINVPKTVEDFILYTPQYDTSTDTTSPTNDPILEIQIELTRPSLIMPSPRYVSGYIRAIHDQHGSTPLPFDSVVLSAWGNVRSALKTRISSGEIAVGDEVRITQEVSSCLNSTQQDWTKTYAAIGGDYHFLNGGDIRSDFSNSDAGVSNSRTAIAYNANYVYFIVVDAFNPGVSEGLNIAELGDFTLHTLGATDAVSVDSGTSSTMIVNDQVMNNTQCNFFRNCGNLAQQDGNPTPDQALLPPEETYGTEWANPTGAVEPLVGTGMMMVVVQPVQRSTTFTLTQNVNTLAVTTLRLGPGSNYGVVGSVPAGTSGVIGDTLSNLNGVLAKGSYWWKVDFGSTVGWVKEETLQGGALPPVYSVYLPAITQTGIAALNPVANTPTQAPSEAGGTPLDSITYPPLDPR